MMGDEFEHAAIIHQHLGGKDVLISSITGSHMWSMDNSDSDVDLTIVYADHITDIVTGRGERSIPSIKTVINGQDCDIAFMEIGHLYNLLAKGNVNAIWIMTSPLAYIKYEEMKDVSRFISNMRLPQSVLASTRGITLSNIIDMKKRKEVRDPQKSYKTALRNILFFIHSVRHGRLFYDIVSDMAFKHDMLCTDKAEQVSGIENYITFAEQLYKDYSDMPHEMPKQYFYNHLLAFRKFQMREFLKKEDGITNVTT